MSTAPRIGTLFAYDWDAQGYAALASRWRCDRAGFDLFAFPSNARLIGFDLERVMRTRYRIDSYQQTYFVIDSYEELIEATLPDFTPIYERLREQDAIPAGSVLGTDAVFQRGNGEGWASDGDV